MDSNRTKRRGLISKSKLVMSLYRATKPSSAAAQPHISKPPKLISPSNNYSSTSNHQPIIYKPKPPPPPSLQAPAASPVGFIIVNQDQVYPQQPPKVAFVLADKNSDSYGKLENFYGAGGVAPEDEGVDDKAAKYISSVRERFEVSA